MWPLSQQATKESFEVVTGWPNLPKDAWKNVPEDQQRTLFWHKGIEILAIRGKWKTLAIITSPIFQSKKALSGYKDDHEHLNIITSSSWTDKAYELASALQVPIKGHDYDIRDEQGYQGRYYACHAEPKLIAFYVDYFKNHRAALEWQGEEFDCSIFTLDITVVSKEPCPTCQRLADRVREIYDIRVNLTFDPMAMLTTKLNKINVHQSKTVHLGFASDVETSGSDSDSGTDSDTN